MPTTLTGVSVIDDLSARIGDDATFASLLVASLTEANAAAREALDPDLYGVLCWPTDIEAYLAYLVDFVRWAPQQSDLPAWWADPSTASSQEVYDRLCHFYFLIDQNVGPDGTTIVQNIPWFADWLVSFADAWGSFLDTTESFSAEILQTFIDDSPKFRVQDSMIDGRPNAPSGWLTFNQFFARELNPGLRPIDSPTDNTVVTSPADCTFKAIYRIGPNSEIEPPITIKQTHTFANVKDLLQDSKYADAFAGGTFVHYFLGPYSYHRFHASVAGLVEECYPIAGLTYLAVDLKGGQFDAPDSAEDGYEFTQARGVISIDTSKASPAWSSSFGDVGIVTVVPVGMCQVSSVNMTAVAGSYALKGDEFGYFLFGGSDIIVLFQAGVTSPERIDQGTQYRHYGTKVADCSVVGG